VAGEADPLVLNFLRLLIEKGRAGEVEQVAEEFERLAAAEEGELSVELTTAYELSDAEARVIIGQIEQRSGRHVEATREVDPALIGGMVLQVGSRRVDASVRGRLEQLGRELRTRV
jgi:F-type H+-transporting ATPase subunit delta